MKKSFKKFIVFTMVCMLALTPMTAFAADGDITTAPAEGSASGSGEIEGIVDKDVFCVSLPTIAEDSDIFNFILDPQQLIAETDAAAFDVGTTFEEGASLFFKSVVSGNTISANSTDDYASQSSSLIIRNKSTFDVDVDVEAELKDLSDEAGTYTIVPKDAEDYTDDTNTSMYLAVKLGDSTTAITAEGATASATVSKVDEEDYEVVYTEEDGYKFELKDDVTEFPATSISLAGSCNTNAEVDWEAAKTAAPSVDLTWSVDKHSDGPTVSITPAGVVTISGLTAEANTNVSMMTTRGTNANTTAVALDPKNISWNVDNWTEADGGTLVGTLGANYPVYYAGDTMIFSVGLTDGTTITGTVTFPAN
ncbi:MAG: hypothetical protein IJ429_00465 [Lachnospiraceae bacterium]|nr:hypothetical protein [Lachnospiraceae bacterium]